MLKFLNKAQIKYDLKINNLFLFLGGKIKLLN